MNFDQKLDAIFSKPTQQLQKFQACLVELGWHGQQAQIEELKKLRKVLSQVHQPFSFREDGFHVLNTNLTSDQAHALIRIGTFADISIIVDVGQVVTKPARRYSTKRRRPPY